MGLPVIDNGYDLGDPCILCWDRMTPLRILAIIGGVRLCPLMEDSPNGFYVLTQTAPCTWVGGNDKFDVFYNATIFMPFHGSALTVNDILFRKYFTSFANSLCAMSFTNNNIEIDCNVNVKGYGGYGVLLFGPGI